LTVLDSYQTDLLQGLSAAELELVLPLFERREFAAGQTILRQGEPADCLLVIESGLVLESVPGPAGRESVLAELGPGQLVGETSILTGQPRAADVRAVVDTVALRLPRSSFFAVAGQAPALLLNIARVLAVRLGQANRAVAQHERRAVVVLVGPAPVLIGSLVATNLAAALAAVSARRTVLFDVPPPHAAPLPGREWAPGLEDAPAGDATLLHLGQLQTGPVAIHVVNLPPPDVLVSSDVDMVATVVSRLARAAEFVVVNLIGLPSEVIDPVLRVANRIYIVLPSGLIERRDVAVLAQRCRDRANPAASLGVITMGGDGSLSDGLRRRVRDAVSVPECTTLPSQADLLRESARVPPPLAMHAPGLAVSAAFSRLAREIARLRVGLALSSGAAKGIAHIGVVTALNRLGIPVDVVTGASAGSLVGAGVALGMDTGQIEEGMNRLVDLWRQALRPALPRIALMSAKGLEQLVRELVGDTRFDELSTPFGAVATDLITGRAIYMREGTVFQAVRASISIPLVFPPVVVGSHVLVDGALTKPVPAELARMLGADVVLACDLSGPVDESDASLTDFVEYAPEQPVAKQQKAPNIVRTYLRCMEIVMARGRAHDDPAADLTLRPRLPPMGWQDFQKGGVPMRAGEDSVQEQLDNLRELLPWLRLAR
jgi:NTE family protein